MPRVYDKQFHVLFKEDLRADIHEYAFKTNVSKAEFVRIAVERYVKHLKAKEEKNEQ